MGAFQSGFGMGQRAYQQGLDNERQAKLDARQEVLNSRADQDYERAQGMQRGVDESFESMRSLQRGVYDGSNADFNTPNPAMLDQGPLPRAAQPQLGLTQRRSESDEPAQPVARRNATELEMEQAMGNVSLAQRDMVGMRNSRGAQKQLFKQQDQRDFVTNIQKLAASDDPKDQAEYQRLLSPALSAYSQFTGIPSNFHFDPTTKSIVETPYGKKNEDGTTAYGAPRGVPMEQAMPFLLAHRSLTQDYGDTEAALKAMQGMKEEERNRLIAEASRTFAQATGLGKAQNDRDMTAGHIDNWKNTASFQAGQLKNAADRNANDAAYRNSSLGMQRERLNLDKMGAVQYRQGDDGHTYAMVPTMGKDGPQLKSIRVNPEGITFKEPKGAKQPDVKLEPGAIFQTPTGERYTVGDNGEKLIDKAPAVGQRTSMLASLGIPKDAAEGMRWLTGGRHVEWGDMAYDVANRKDMVELANNIRNQKINDKAEEEFSRGRSGWPNRGLPYQRGVTDAQSPLNADMQRPAFTFQRP